MIEVCSEGCTHGLRLDITLNRQDTRSKFGYIKLSDLDFRQNVNYSPKGVTQAWYVPPFSNVYSSIALLSLVILHVFCDDKRTGYFNLPKIRFDVSLRRVVWK